MNVHNYIVVPKPSLSKGLVIVMKSSKKIKGRVNASVSKVTARRMVNKKAVTRPSRRVVSKMVTQKHTVKKVGNPKAAGTGRLQKPSVVEVVEDVEKVKEAHGIISSVVFSDFVSKNVGRQALTLVDHLNSGQLTDDKLATKMNIKVNEVRRMLNVLNGYGITKYEINKDSKGWLTFKWYVDRQKLTVFHGTLMEKQQEHGPALQENCNDFFFCPACYEDQKVILPFDSAFEVNFRCECGKLLEVLDKEQANSKIIQPKTTPV